MDDKLLFVQFPHPGREHEPDNGLIKEWNKNCHKRKFMKQAGKYLTDAKDKKAKKGDMVFWGEWEPQSTAERIDNPINRGAHYIYEPYYVVPKSYDGLENTDPFVFGDRFHYFGCKQPTFKQLSHLLPGSVILFGSCENNGFVLDTLFVAGNHWIDHSSVKDLERHVSDEYMEVTVFPWYENVANGRACAGANSQKCRLYFGASHDNPIYGMYSFFPCQPYVDKSKGFARPKIDLPQINPKKCAGVKYTGAKYQDKLNPDEMKLLWDKVVERVIGDEQHLALGVYADQP